MTTQSLVSAPAQGGIIVAYPAGAVARWIAASPGQLLALIAVGLPGTILSALSACGTAMFMRTDQAGSLIQLQVFVLLFFAGLAGLAAAAERAAAP